MIRILILAIGLVQAAAFAQCTEITVPTETDYVQHSDDPEPGHSQKIFYPAQNGGIGLDSLTIHLEKVSGPDDWNYQFCEGVEFCRPIFAWETGFTITEAVPAGAEREYDVEFIASSYGTGVLELTIVRSLCPDDTIRQTLSFTLDDDTAVAERPARPVLAGNWPNPFNPSTHIPFRLDAASPVRVEVVDLTGRRVATPLPQGLLPAGEHDVLFDAAGLPSGVYLYRVITPLGVSSAPMTLLK